jgi:glycerophosphoryl diester phosphodiesterase
MLLATAWGSQWPEWEVLNIAHRGGIVPGYAENTLAAYRRAISLGVDVIEIDLRGTRDGEIIILHDETLDRTTDGTGKVTDFTLEELKQLNAGGGESIPTYAEVLDFVADTGVKLLLDIKVSPVLDKGKVVRLTESHDAELDVIVGVRNLGDLREFRRLNPNIRALGFIRSPGDIDDFVAGGIDIIRLWPEWIQADQEIVGKVQRLGKPVWTTAGDASREMLEELIRSGVNGILSDFPEVTSRVMADLEARQRGAQ